MNTHPAESFVDDPQKPGESPQTMKEACLVILKAQINDLRALEKCLVILKVGNDVNTRFSKKIGGLKKCIAYIEGH